MKNLKTLIAEPAKPVTQKEKFEHLNRKNPALKLLAETFDLVIKL